MRKVGSRELKNRLGRYLQMIRRGESLEITDRGTTVAKLVPPASHESEGSWGVQAFLAALSREGNVRVATQRIKPSRAAKSKGRPASEAIIEDRR